MIRKFKAIGLAFVAVFAMSALVASAAQAAPGNFRWQEEGVVIKANQEPLPAGSQKFVTTAGTVTCDTVTGETAALTGTTAASITTKQIEYSHTGKTENKCTGPLGTEPKIEMNGCQYRFNAGNTVGEASKGETEGTVDILGCTGGENSITVNGGGLCTVHIPEQNGVGPVKYRTINPSGVEQVTIEPLVTNIKYRHTGLCGNGEAANGQYTGTVVAFGEKGGVAKHATVE